MGVMSAARLWPQVRAEANGESYRPAGVFIIVEGTAYPGCPNPPMPILDDGTGWWGGFSSGMVGGVTNAQDGLWDCYLVGYSAPTLPMWPGVQEARETVVEFLLWYAPLYKSLYGVYPPIILSGYSQGSMSTDQLWVLDFLADNGRLNFLKDFVYRIYQFGHIFRTPGIAHGNALAGLPESIIQDGVETGGIGGPLDLTAAQTNYLAPDGKPVVYSCANKGDIYSCCSVGLTPWTKLAAEGAVADIFYQVVMQPTFSDVVSVAKVLEHPIDGIIELFHVMAFFAAGVNAPHYQYFPQMDACIKDALALGNLLPHSLGV